MSKTDLPPSPPSSAPFESFGFRLLDGWFQWAFVWTTLTAIGCGTVDSTEPCIPIHGRLVWGGRPISGARIVLHPTGSPGSERLADCGYPRATTDADGEFTVSTRVAGDGAPCGEYALLITWPRVEQAREPGTDLSIETSVADDQFAGTFATLAGSPKRILVRGPRTQLGAIDLTAGSGPSP